MRIRNDDVIAMGGSVYRIEPLGAGLGDAPALPKQDLMNVTLGEMASLVLLSFAGGLLIAAMVLRFVQ